MRARQFRDLPFSRAYTHTHTHIHTRIPCQASLLSQRHRRFATPVHPLAENQFLPISASSNLLEEPKFLVTYSSLNEVIERCINCRYNISPIYISFHFLRISFFLNSSVHHLNNIPTEIVNNFEISRISILSLR